MATKKRKVEPLTIEHVDPSVLQEWAKNPRQNDSAVDRLVGLIEAHGFANPIIATRDGVVRAGNTRLKAALKMHLVSVPVIYMDFASEEDAELFSLSDNKSSEWAKWDKDMLIEIFAALPPEMMEEQERLSGFTTPELEGLKMNQDSSADDFKTDDEDDKPGATEYWAWVQFGNKKEMDRVMERVSELTGGKHQISAGRLLTLVSRRKSAKKIRREI